MPRPMTRIRERPLAAIAEPLRERGKALADRLRRDAGLPRSTTCSRRADVDALSICVPHDLHSRRARRPCERARTSCSRSRSRHAGGRRRDHRRRPSAEGSTLMLGFVHRFRTEVLDAKRRHRGAGDRPSRLAPRPLLLARRPAPAPVGLGAMPGRRRRPHVRRYPRRRPPPLAARRRVMRCTARAHEGTGSATSRTACVALLDLAGGATATLFEHSPPFGRPGGWATEVFGTDGAIRIQTGEWVELTTSARDDRVDVDGRLALRAGDRRVRVGGRRVARRRCRRRRPRVARRRAGRLRLRRVERDRGYTSSMSAVRHADVPGRDVRAAAMPLRRAADSRLRRIRRAPAQPLGPARAIAISFVLDCEEGGERSISTATRSPRRTSTIVGRAPVEARLLHRIAVRVWEAFRVRRVHRLSTSRAAAADLCGRTGARANPEAARAMDAAGWRVVGDGWRWIDYVDVPEEVSGSTSPHERDHRAAQPPAAWRPLRRTDESAHAKHRRRGGPALRLDRIADELPYWVDVDGTPPIVPSTLDCNDYKSSSPAVPRRGELRPLHARHVRATLRGRRRDDGL